MGGHETGGRIDRRDAQGDVTETGVAIVIGATSGIGRALAQELASRGWRVGATGRREALLTELSEAAPGQIVTEAMDVTRVEEAAEILQKLIGDLGGAVDLIVINAGVGHVNSELDEALDLSMIDTNARGFAVLASAAFKYFSGRRSGHLVGITSVAAERAGPAIAYSATKAFASRYLDGLRLKAQAEKIPVSVTDIRPGFVDTAMIDREKAFWVASPETAARQIVNALPRNSKVLYVTRRWRLVAAIMRWLPDIIYSRLR